MYCRGVSKLVSDFRSRQIKGISFLYFIVFFCFSFHISLISKKIQTKKVFIEKEFKKKRDGGIDEEIHFIGIL